MVVKGTSLGLTTCENGRFTPSINENSGALLISFVGMETIEVPLTSENTYSVTLKDVNTDLGEVVETALGITREKKALGYSVQEIKGEEVTMARDPNVLNSLSGKIAGVQITSGGSTVGSSPRITIRGNASFGNNTPLFVVDGIPNNNFA